MTAWRHALTTRHRALALWIVAAALILKIFIPVGWMPVIGADGLTRITLCSGEGRVEAWVDRAGDVHKKAPGSDPRHDQPCAFSALATALADVRSSLPVAASPIFVTEPPARPRNAAIGRGLPAPPPPSTGPPLHA